MFDSFKSEKRLIRNLFLLFQIKKKSSKPAEIKKIIKRQIRLIYFINRSSRKVKSHLLKELIGHYSNQEESLLFSQLTTVNSAQENLIIDSLEEELNFIMERLASLKTVLLEEQANPENYSVLFEQENVIVSELSKMIEEEGTVEKKLSRDLASVKKVEHSDLFMKINRGLAKLVTFAKLNLIIEGQENIPMTGPVILAPRHLHRDYDPMIFNSIVKRRLFFIGAIDWMQGKFFDKTVKYFFKKSGVIGVKRPEANDIFAKAGQVTERIKNKERSLGLVGAFKNATKLLMHNQAVLIFPEGWPTIETAMATPKTDMNEILEVKAGVFHFAEYVQRKRGIPVPIIPIGLKLVKEGIFKLTFVVNIGEPMYLPMSKSRVDYKPHIIKLTNYIRKLSA